MFKRIVVNAVPSGLRGLLASLAGNIVAQILFELSVFGAMVFMVLNEVSSVKAQLALTEHGLVGTASAVIVSVTLLAIGWQIVSWAGDEYVEAAKAFAKALLLPVVVAVLIIGFGTSGTELGMVIVAFQAGATIFMATSIVASDYFNASVGIGIGMMVSAIPFLQKKDKEGKLKNEEKENPEEAGLITPLAIWVGLTLMTLVASYIGFSFGMSRALMFVCIIGALAFAVDLFAPIRGLVGTLQGKRKAKCKNGKGLRLMMRIRVYRRLASPLSALRQIPRILMSLGALIIGTQLIYDGLMVLGKLAGLSDKVLGYFGAIISSLPEILTMRSLFATEGLRGIIQSMMSSDMFDLAFLSGAGMKRPFETGDKLHNTAIANVVAAIAVVALAMWLKKTGKQAPHWAFAVVWTVVSIVVMIATGSVH